MLAQDVENTGRAKPNMSKSQIPPTGGIRRPRVYTQTHTHKDHTYTDTHTNKKSLVHSLLDAPEDTDMYKDTQTDTNMI